MMATINDLVLVHIDNKAAFYARIDDISPDQKPGWWQVTLLALTVPLQVITWILDEHQIAGADFTMGGTPVRLDPVLSPVNPNDNSVDKEIQESTKNSPSAGTSQKVVSLAERRKK